MAAVSTVAGPAAGNPAAARASFAGTVRSELTKIRSVRSTYWTLLALVVITVGIGCLASLGAERNPTGDAGLDVVRVSLAGLYLGQLVIGVLGALTITSEYSTGMIRTSLTVQPHRGTVLAAKALVFAVVSAVVGLVASFGSFFIGQAIMSGHHLGVSLSHPGALRAVIGGVLFLVVSGMLAFGIGSILRSTAGAITTVVGLLFVVTVVVQFLPNSWQLHVNEWMPAIAGSQAWTDRPSVPPHLLSPWAGLAVFAVYAAVALVAGLALFIRRDA